MANASDDRKKRAGPFSWLYFAKFRELLIALEEREVGRVAKLTYLGILSHADAGGNAWPGRDTIAKVTGLSVRSVASGLTELEAAGLIQRSRRPLKNAPNEYVVYDPRLDGAPKGKANDAHPDHEDRQTVPTGRANRARPVGQTVPTNGNHLTGTNERDIAPVETDAELKRQTESAFRSVNDNWTSWPKERKAIQRLVHTAKEKRPDDPAAWIDETMTAFHRLKKSGSSFWKKQPFTPSVLSSNGILSRVLEEKKQQATDTDTLETIMEVFQ